MNGRSYYNSNQTKSYERKFLLSCFLLMTLLAMAQQRTVSGKVTASEDGLPLQGVNVVLRNHHTGAVTDGDGRYTLNVPNEIGLLIFSFIWITGGINMGFSIHFGCIAEEADVAQVSDGCYRLALSAKKGIGAIGLKRWRLKLQQISVWSAARFARQSGRWALLVPAVCPEVQHASRCAKRPFIVGQQPAIIVNYVASCGNADNMITSWLAVVLMDQGWPALARQYWEFGGAATPAAAQLTLIWRSCSQWCCVIKTKNCSALRAKGLK